MQTILITGGTGLIGKRLSQSLTEIGYRVIILTRDITGKQATDKLSFALWDVKKKQVDLKALAQADYIVHLAGAGVVDKKWTDNYKKEIIESRTESSRLIIENLKNNRNSVKALVSASAIGWYGADTHPLKPFTESDVADESFLGQTCKLWEQSVDPVTDLGIRLVKLRTGIVLSNNGGALAEFKRPLQLGVAAILGNGRQVVSWIHIDDLCRLFINAIENEDLKGSYNAVAPEPVTNKKLTLTLAKKLRGAFYLPIHIPSFFLKIILGDRSIEVLKSSTVSCKKILDTGFTFCFKTIEDALGDLTKK